MAYIISILESFLGEPRSHTESTGQISFDCPACSLDKGMSNGDGKGNLELNYNEGVFKCWACKDINDMHGTITKLIKRFGTSSNLKEYRLFKPDIKDRPQKILLELKIPEGFRFLKDCTSRDFKYTTAINYLTSRGITSDIIEKFNIGYTTKGKFFNRIIIPSYNENGILNYFVARWFDSHYTKLKYLNPEDIEKQAIIFNENKINWDATIYLVEGVVDHIVVPNSIPLLGKYISDILLDAIYEKANAGIVILLDSDAFEDARELYYQLNFGKLTNRIKICHPPDGYDPARVHEKFSKSGIIKLLQRTRTLKEWETQYS